jgi:Ca2+-binding RTX toxin-like protein
VLRVKWVFGQPAATTNTLTGAPTIRFDDVKAQLGELLKNTVGPVLTNVNKVLAPIKPLINVLQARLPVLSDLMGQKVTLTDVAKLFGNADVANYINAAGRADSLRQLAQSLATSNAINLGGFSFSLPQAAANLDGVTLSNIFAPATKPIDQARGDEKKFFAGVGVSDGLKFPLFEKPTTAFNLLLGRDVDLVTFDMPKLSLQFNYEQFFPVLGPLGANVTGKIGAQVDFNFGLDTAAFRGGKSLLDGFYVSDTDKNGVDVAEAIIFGELTAGAEFNAAAVSAGVKGGIFANVDFNLHDNNNDGKVRLAEMTENLKLGAVHIFDVTGALTAALKAYVEVDLIVWSDRYEYRIADKTLLDFNLARPSAASTFNPGNVNSVGQLTLVTGTGDDSYSILPGTKAGEIVIRTRGFEYTRTNVKRIVFTGGEGDDTFSLDDAVALLAGGSVSADGGKGHDVLSSGNAPAVLIGGEGDDQLTAGTGATRMDGGAGKDFIAGGLGNDTIDGGDGDDLLQGSDGNDTIRGGAGNDQITGEIGNDNLDGGTGDDLVNGGSGNDTITSASGLDRLNGNDGNDTITSTSTAVANVTGGSGDDRITTGANHDVIFGDDATEGASGNDTIFAGGGNDTIYGDAGADTLLGGDGNDTLYAGFGPAAGTTTTSSSRMFGGAGDDVFYGTAGADSINGDAGDDIAFALGGNDSLDGGDGADQLNADDGDDRVVGGSGNDYLRGGRGNDFMYGGSATALPAGATDDDVLLGGAGSDVLGGGAGNDILVGDADAANPRSDGGATSGADAFGNDQLFGGAGLDVLYGQGGNDSIYGNDGFDELFGGSGNDALYGGRDSDSIEGNNGADFLYGGTGADVLELDTDAANTVTGDTVNGYGGNGKTISATGVQTADVVQDDHTSAVDILFISGTSGNDKITIGEVPIAGTTAGRKIDVAFTTAAGTRHVQAVWKDSTGAPLVRQIQIAGLDGNDTINFSSTFDVSKLPTAGDPRGFVTGIFGGNGNDTLDGTRGRDQIYGGAGNDTIRGFGGDDKLWGDDIAGGDAPTALNKLYGGAGDDDIIGGRGTNQLYAWSTVPLSSATDQFGVFTRPDGTLTQNDGDLNNDGKLDSDTSKAPYAREQTGIDRMLGGAYADSFYGANAVAFMYGNGGTDIIYDSAGKAFAGSPLGTDDEQWKRYARASGRVWYVPGSETRDVINVELVGGEVQVRIESFNRPANVDEHEYENYLPVLPVDPPLKASVAANRSTNATQFRLPGVTNDGSFGQAATAGLYQQAGDWGAVRGAPTSVADFDVILIDAFGGHDSITVNLGVPKTVWADGGSGDDRIEIKSGGAILADQLEGNTTTNIAGNNNTAATASSLGAVTASQLLTGLSIHRAAKPLDVDWFKFALSATPTTGDSITVRGLQLTDNMRLDLYASATSTTPIARSVDGVLDLFAARDGGKLLTAGKTYYLRVTSNNNDPEIGLATIYDLSFKVTDADPRNNVRDMASGRPVSNLDVLLGGEGNDDLRGGNGADWILGGNGNDTLRGGVDLQATDLIFGGDGDDSILVTLSDLPIVATRATYVVGDVFNGGGDAGDAVVIKGKDENVNDGLPGTRPDFLAVDYNPALNLYTVAGKVWLRGVNGQLGAFTKNSASQDVLQYQFFTAAEISAIKVVLEGGNDQLNADGAGYVLSNGGTFAMPATAPYGLSVDAGAGDDVITTGGTNDNIVGGLGDDNLNAGDGNNVIIDDATGSGNNTLTSGSGVDSIFAGDGNDTINAGDGANLVRAGNGTNTVDTGSGDDDIITGENNDLVNSGGGKDRIDVGEGRGNWLSAGVGNRVYSGAGDDFVTGGAHRDEIFGEGGDDEIYGEAGNDYLVGDTDGVEQSDDGKDTIDGGADNDTIYGGGADDTLWGGWGIDGIEGGSGNDRIRGGLLNSNLGSLTDYDSLHGGRGHDYIYAALATGFLTTRHWNTISGGDDSDFIFGNRLIDRIHGNGGDDLIYGYENNDDINGDEGDDTIRGGYGDDVIVGGYGLDTLYGEGGKDTIYGGADADYIFGGSSTNSTGSGNDELHGGTGDDRLFGADGDDALYGETDNDYLRGGTGNDFLSGSVGSDTLTGDAGRDTLKGGSGNDKFYARDNEVDIIDPDSGSDTIDRDFIDRVI